MTRFTGTGQLTRFALRRDRTRLSVWVVATAGGLVALANVWETALATPEELASRAILMENPAMVAFNGPQYALEDYTLGAMVTNEALGLGALVVALMAVLLMVRHTRAEEESGRAELVRATVVGRFASITAALLVVAGASVAVGLLTGLGLAATVADLPLGGSLAFGAALAATGLVFAGVGAVSAQVAAHSRSANGIGIAAIAVAYVLRAVGDVGENALSWLSPIGWSQATRPFIDERWWPLALSVAATAGCALVAGAVSVRRDVGAGLIPPRPGPAFASESLVRPVGFAWRLQRGTVVAWAAAVALIGAAFGATVDGIEEFLADNPQLEEILGAADVSVLDSFLGLVTFVLALLATAAAVLVTLRMPAEEEAGRLDPLLATALSRARWYASQLAVALTAGGLTLVAGGVGLGVSAGVARREAGMVPELVGAAIGYLPAVAATVGAVTVLYGLVPRAAGWGWAVLGYGLLVGLFADALDLPGWLRNLSPFEHVPRLPGVAVATLPLAVLAAVAVVLLAIGLAGFRRRGVRIM